MKASKKAIIIMSILVTTLLTIGCSGKDENHEEHSDHSGHEQHEEHSDHEERGENEDEQTNISVSEQGKILANIKIEKVKKVSIGKQLILPGEIGFNEDNMAHITPRYAGIAREVKANIGQYVRKGTVLAVIESNESLSSYKIVAPISGRVISKHVTIGEFKTEEEVLFVIANLASVWVNCVIYPKYMNSVKPGQKIHIQAVDSEKNTEAVITYVAPVISESTRSAIARAIIHTPNGEWRPGMFIKGTVELATPEPVLALVKKAIQVLDDKEIVFIPTSNNSFAPVEIETGLSNSEYVQLVSNLNIGDEYVTDGAFELKAKIVTSSLGGHAGHGH